MARYCTEYSTLSYDVLSRSYIRQLGSIRPSNGRHARSTIAPRTLSPNAKTREPIQHTGGIYNLNIHQTPLSASGPRNDLVNQSNNSNNNTKIVLVIYILCPDPTHVVVSSAPPFVAHPAHIVVSSTPPSADTAVNCYVTRNSSIDPVEDRRDRLPLRERVVLDAFWIESGKTSG